MSSALTAVSPEPKILTTSLARAAAVTFVTAVVGSAADMVANLETQTVANNAVCP